jgi:catechol 2,3-dioxygenase-like lactoylglutathione lyase family enzyme
MGNHLFGPSDQYHVGIVVREVESAAARLSALSGYEWTKPIEYSLAVTTPAGQIELHSRFVYSLQAPHLELIQQVPGTIWIAGAHHLGYWVDDIGAAATSLEQAGYTQEARPSEGPLTKFAYYTDPAGIRIEIVDRATFADWPAFLKTMSAAA